MAAKKKSRSKNRTPAQKAATARMIAANKRAKKTGAKRTRRASASSTGLVALSKRVNSLGASVRDHEKRLDGHDQFVVAASKEIDSMGRRIKGLESLSGALFDSKPGAFKAFRPAN